MLPGSCPAGCHELGMGPKEFAIRACKPEKTIAAVLNGSSSITPEMAVQFEQVLNIPAHFWLTMQRSYDEFHARKKYHATVGEFSALGEALSIC